MRIAARVAIGEIAGRQPRTRETRLKDSIELPRKATEARRVRAVVALRLLEVIRDRDLPREILQEEDPARTMPRRFGLSEVVERQIRTYKEDVRKRVRLTDDDVGGLFRFVIRRPDAEEVFHQVGRLLAGVDRPGRWSRILPRRLQFAVARRRTLRRLGRVFGRTVGGFGRGSFVIEGRSLFFIESDPGGAACHLVSGLAREVLEQTLGVGVRVGHTRCQSRGDALCRWEGEVADRASRLVDHPSAETEA